MFKILLIDDSDTIRHQLAEMIDSIDRTIIMAANGKEGLDRFMSDPEIGLIFCDINMPVMDGIQFVESVAAAVEKGQAIRCPIVILTTESEVAKVMRAKKAGITGWLIKPPKKETIEKIIAKFSGTNAQTKKAS